MKELCISSYFWAQIKCILYKYDLTLSSESQDKEDEIWGLCDSDISETKQRGTVYMGTLPISLGMRCLVFYREWLGVPSILIGYAQDLIWLVYTNFLVCIFEKVGEYYQ